MGIVNDVTYTSMKNRNTKFFVLWATQKWQNQIWRFENIHTQIHMFVIFVQIKMQNIRNWYFEHIWINYWRRTDFFHIF
jgi:hypothetical protein